MLHYLRQQNLPFKLNNLTDEELKLILVTNGLAENFYKDKQHSDPEMYSKYVYPKDLTIEQRLERLNHLEPEHLPVLVEEEEFVEEETCTYYDEKNEHWREYWRDFYQCGIKVQF